MSAATVAAAGCASSDTPSRGGQAATPRASDRRAARRPRVHTGTPVRGAHDSHTQQPQQGPPPPGRRDTPQQQSRPPLDSREPGCAAPAPTPLGASATRTARRLSRAPQTASPPASLLPSAAAAARRCASTACASAQRGLEIVGAVIIYARRANRGTQSGSGQRRPHTAPGPSHLDS